MGPIQSSMNRLILTSSIASSMLAHKKATAEKSVLDTRAAKLAQQADIAKSKYQIRKFKSMDKELKAQQKLKKEERYMIGDKVITNPNIRKQIDAQLKQGGGK